MIIPCDFTNGSHEDEEVDNKPAGKEGVDSAEITCLMGTTGLSQNCGERRVSYNLAVSDNTSHSRFKIGDQ